MKPLDFKALTAPFSPMTVEWRVGATSRDKTSGLALAYIDARHVMERLDEVCGPAGWQCRYPTAAAKTCCEIGINVNGEWVWKADGAGDTDIEGSKGAFSDAFKRAAVRWGIGRYLYHVKAPWVRLETVNGRQQILASEQPKLLALLTGEPAPKQEKTEPVKTALREKAKEMVAEILSCDDKDQLLGLVSTDIWKSEMDELDRLLSLDAKAVRDEYAKHVNRIELAKPLGAG